MSDTRDARTNGHGQALVMAVLAVAVAACNAKPIYPAEPVKCDPEMRAWILDCIEKANPHSDEEPEDSTKQCEQTATRLFCGPSCFVSINGPVVCR